MKITKQQLKKIIKEEFERAIAEEDLLSGSTRAPRTQGREPEPNPSDPLSGPTRGEPVSQTTSGDNTQLALVAKELQLLLAKIQKALKT